MISARQHQRAKSAARSLGPLDELGRHRYRPPKLRATDVPTVLCRARRERVRLQFREDLQRLAERGDLPQKNTYTQDKNGEEALQTKRPYV